MFIGDVKSDSLVQSIKRRNLVDGAFDDEGCQVEKGRGFNITFPHCAVVTIFGMLASCL